MEKYYCWHFPCRNSICWHSIAILTTMVLAKKKLNRFQFMKSGVFLLHRIKHEMYGRVSFYWVLPISRCIIPLIKRRERIRDSAKSTTKIPSYHTQKRYSIGRNVSRIYHTHSHAHSQDLCSHSFTKFLQQYINYQSKYEMKWNTMKKICAFHFNLSRCLSSMCVLFYYFFSSLSLSSVDHFSCVAHVLFVSARMHWTLSETTTTHRIHKHM